MNCDSAHRLIDAYMDSELEPRDSVEVESHLADCASCRRLLEGRQALSRVIKSSAVYASAPTSLRTQLLRKTNSRPRLRFGLVTTALAFAVGVAMVMGVWRPWDSADRARDWVVDDVFAQHRSAMAGPRLVDLRTSDPGAAQSWFCAQIGYAPQVPKMRDNYFNLIGARVDLVAKHRVPVLVFSHGSDKIDLFVTPGDMIQALDTDRQGVHVRAWTNCGLNYWAVSTGPTLDLDFLHQEFLSRS